MVLVLSIPQTASAGFWSFLGIGGEDETVQISNNSQNIALLEPNGTVLFEKVPVEESESTFMFDKNAITPQTTLSGETVEKDVAMKNDQISLYVVKNGDTMSEIAKMFDVSQATIRWANDMSKNSVLKVGQTLTILPINGISYTVKKGDTLKSIAKKYNSDAGEIAQFNDLTLSSEITVGQNLILPEGEILETSTSSSKNSATTQQNTTSTGSYFIRPVPGPRTQGRHGKNSVDIGGQTGTPIKAAASGKVIIADDYGYNGGYGQYVVISHSNGTQTLYAHMSRIDVSSGQKVTQGEVIGAIGSTGKSTGPHLHFEVRGATNPIAINANYGR